MRKAMEIISNTFSISLANTEVKHTQFEILIEDLAWNPRILSVCIKAGNK